MDEGSILGSLDRIETAIARIERAAQYPMAVAITTAEPMVDAQLEQRHVALKLAVEQALSRIDNLIGDEA